MKWRYVPTPYFEEDYLDFKINYEDKGCSCMFCAPCNWCTHPGNPHNGVEFERCYNVGDCGTVISENHLRYLVDAVMFTADSAVHETFASWSVRKALNLEYIA